MAKSKKQTKPVERKRARTAGSVCVWPSGVEVRFGISAPTRWRWEKDGKLPRRDVFVGGVAVGWKPSTLETAERGPVAA
jgi:predicted DNA-binding transcriptional regulator AlpA